MRHLAKLLPSISRASRHRPMPQVPLRTTGAQRRVRSPMPCADGELSHWEWPSGWPDRNHWTSERLASVRLSRTGSSWDGNRGCGGTVRTVEQQLKNRRGPAELPEDGWASDPHRGEPGAAGARRPDSAGPVRQGKGPQRQASKSVSNPARASFGRNHRHFIVPTAALRGALRTIVRRLDGNLPVVLQLAVRSAPGRSYRKLQWPNAPQPPCWDGSFPVSHASSARTSSRFLASRPQATPIRWTGSAWPPYLSA